MGTVRPKSETLPITMVSVVYSRKRRLMESCSDVQILFGVMSVVLSVESGFTERMLRVIR